MTILHYIPSLSRGDGGTSMYMQQLAATLGQRVDLHIVTHRTPDELPVSHARIHCLSQSLRWWVVEREFRALLDELRPDVVHVNCCWKPYFALVVTWAKAAGYPVVLTPHGMLEPWIMRQHYLLRKLPALLLWQRRALFAADVIHATATTEQQNILRLADEYRLLRGWNPRVEIIANGIEVERIEVKTRWERSQCLLFMSRIHPKKGIDMLLRAFASLCTEDGVLQAYRLQIAGGGDDEYLAELQALARELSVDGRVDWLGAVFGDRKWQLIREADLVVLPTHSENFGIIVAEALASGTPVLTTVGTPWSELQTQRCGWWVDVSEEAIRHALEQFAALPASALAEMGRNGRRLVEDKYSTRKVAEEFVCLYQDLCKR